MKQMNINGGPLLTGTIEISGAKNSAVALIPAAILSDEKTAIANVPNISDIDDLEEILTYLNAKMERKEDMIVIDSSKLENKEIPEEISQKLRASYYFMGALLGKYKKVQMFFPGGCTIGTRPIDQHLKGFEALGAKVIEQGNYFVIEADELKGARIRFDMPGKGATSSVGATINVMLAAVKAKGTTILENCACEPEVVNVATYLNNMGAKIFGAGTKEIKIYGVDYLGSCFNEIIPDRIEAGTYVILGSLLGNPLTITNVIPEHIEALTDKLIEAGADLEISNDYIVAKKSQSLKPINIKTLVYPGFPTDLQQLITVLLTQCEGTSTVQETIYSNRLMTVPYLNEMGANIEITNTIPYNNKIVVKGKTSLKGSVVSATDLRGGASLVIAGLIAQGITVIDEVNHILRGYEHIVEKLKAVGANIEIIENND